MKTDLKEHHLKAQLMLAFRTKAMGFLCFRHEDKMTHGIPDISVTGGKHTSWLEVKHANPDFPTKGQQELNMIRLERIGHYARYIIYDENKGDPRTLIVKPSKLGEWTSSFEYEHPGFNHAAVISRMILVHSNDNDGS